MSDEKLVFNGIDAETGGYLTEFSLDQLAAIAQGAKLDAVGDAEIRNRAALADKSLEVADGIDRENLAQTGWGVIFAADADPAIKDALKPLLDLRKTQAGNYYFEFDGKKGYVTGETKPAFLRNRGAEETGPADPERGMPYYLMLVGDPHTIPYRFQHLLDVTYSVGRLHFDGEDALTSYANYAANVVAAESGSLEENRRTLFFGPSNEDDGATSLSSKYLIQPVAERLQSRFPGWEQSVISGEAAKKASLAEILNGSDAPALLFTASHGMAFSKGNAKQLPHNGALLCGDWPGPEEWQQKPVPEDFYFHAGDIKASADLRGTIAFNFACYGGGTPEMDTFAKQAFRAPVNIADRSFVAALPQRMIGHSRGALAVIGHIERAWGCSFLGERNQAQTGVFDNTLRRLLNGGRVGAALEFFNDRYAELATQLSDTIEESEQRDLMTDKQQLAYMWTAQNDARGYAILGDPAVYLPSAKIPADEIDPNN